MSRIKIDWRSASKANYKNFCEKHKDIELTFTEWKNIIYIFNESFRNYILETGEKVRMPFGFGDFSINKKKRRRKKIGVNGQEIINLPIDWQETKKRGKVIYNFNYHTDGYFFGWMWFKKTALFKQSKLWYFKPSRVSSRMVNHYISTDNKYQHIYRQWSRK